MKVICTHRCWCPWGLLPRRLNGIVPYFVSLVRVGPWACLNCSAGFRRFRVLFRLAIWIDLLLRQKNTHAHTYHHHHHSSTLSFVDVIAPSPPQVVFLDATEVLLSEEARLITFVDKNGDRETLALLRALDEDR